MLFQPLKGTNIIQRDSMPTAGSEIEGKVVQYVGATGVNYTHGYFYECVSDGGNPATYSWTQTNVQPTPSGLPSQTGNSGKFLTTDGTDASWATINALQNESTGGTGRLTILGTPITTGNNGINIGVSSTTAGNGVSIGASAGALGLGVAIGANASSSATTSVAIGGTSASSGVASIAIGSNSTSSGWGSVALGRGTSATANSAIQLGCGGQGVTVTNSDADTLKVANTGGNFEIMSADGTIPTDRYTTTPSADGTYVPTLTISSGVATRSWAAPGDGGGSTATTALLDEMGWSGNSQTVNVTGVTASNNVIVSAAPASQSDYSVYGIICTAQGAGTLTFTCDTVPTTGITVNVLII